MYRRKSIFVWHLNELYFRLWGQSFSCWPVSCISPRQSRLRAAVRAPTKESDSGATCPSKSCLRTASSSTCTPGHDITSESRFFKGWNDNAGKPLRAHFHTRWILAAALLGENCTPTRVPLVGRHFMFPAVNTYVFL